MNKEGSKAASRGGKCAGSGQDPGHVHNNKMMRGEKPKGSTCTLRQVASANAMGNHLVLRVGAPLIRFMHIAPEMRRGTVLKIGTLEIGPHLSPTARTPIIFGSA